MSSGQLKLDSEHVLQALRSEAPGDLSSQQQAQLLSRIEASAVALAAAASLGSIGGNGNALNAGLDAPLSMTDRISALLAAHPIATLLTTLALGGALGAGIHASVTSRHHRAINASAVAGQVVAQAPAVVVPSANPIVAVGDLPRIASAPQAAVGTSPPIARATAAAGKQSAEPAALVAPAEAPGLAEQLALLETARNAIRQRDAAAALRALESHAAQFPTSALAEEREALTIRALVLANRHAEASSRMAKFEAAYPGSLLLPALRTAVGNFP